MPAAVPENKLTNRRRPLAFSVCGFTAGEGNGHKWKVTDTLLLRDREERNCPRQREKKKREGGKEEGREGREEGGGAGDWTITLPQQGNQLGRERGKHLCNLDGRPLPSHENYPRLLVQSISCQGSRAVAAAAAAAAAHRGVQYLPTSTPRPSWSLKHPWRLGPGLPHGGKRSGFGQKWSSVSRLVFNTAPWTGMRKPWI